MKCGIPREMKVQRDHHHTPRNRGKEKGLKSHTNEDVGKEFRSPGKISGLRVGLQELMGEKVGNFQNEF